MLGAGVDGLIRGLIEKNQHGPELRGRGGMPWDRGVEINGEGASAAFASTAIGTEDSLSAQHASGGIGRTAPVEEGMQDEKTGYQTMRTSGGTERKKAREACRDRRGNGAKPWDAAMAAATQNGERERRRILTAGLGPAGKARCAKERRDWHGTAFPEFSSQS